MTPNTNADRVNRRRKSTSLTAATSLYTAVAAAVAVLASSSQFVAPVASFSVAPAFGRHPATATAGVRRPRNFSSLRSNSDDDSDESQVKEGKEVDIDSLTSISELISVSLTVGGPDFSTYSDSSLEAAKDEFWTFVRDSSAGGINVDDMSMEELQNLKVELTGEEGGFAEGTTLEEARDIVWGMASQVHDENDEGCQCGDCPPKYGPGSVPQESQSNN